MEILDENELKEVPEEFIEDNFYMKDGLEIVVLNNAIYNGTVPDDALIMCKVVLNENGEDVLKALTEEEYNSAFARYQELLELFEGEDNA